MQALPEALARAAAADWSAGLPVLATAERLYVVGRGTGLAVAQEAALKFKETCGIQAEAFSGAELRHGPMALVGAGYPVLVFAPRGPAQTGLLALAAELRQRGAAVLLAAPAGTPGVDLLLEPAADDALDTITAIQSFYPFVEALARTRGRNPDAPAFLSKVTLTH
jgi:glucosamine--fructose-6-phosphate aminotransferase (isomerizing)